MFFTLGKHANWGVRNKLPSFFNTKKEQFRLEEKLPRSFPLYQARAAAAHRRGRRPTPGPGPRAEEELRGPPGDPLVPTCLRFVVLLQLRPRAERAVRAPAAPAAGCLSVGFPTGRLWERFHCFGCREAPRPSGRILTSLLGSRGRRGCAAGRRGADGVAASRRAAPSASPRRSRARALSPRGSRTPGGCLTASPRTRALPVATSLVALVPL